MVIHTRKCKICNNISEDELCQICCDEYRNREELCIVNSVNDLFILEELRQFNGKYFVIESIEECDFTQLENMVKNGVKEIIFAISPSYENDHLILKIEDQLQDYDIKYSKIAQGVPTGVSLENLDSLSILRSFQSRVDA
jgi:recombination protein RecR